MSRTALHPVLPATLVPLLLGLVLACARAEAAPPPSDARDARDKGAEGKGDKPADPVLPHHFAPEE